MARMGVTELKITPRLFFYGKKTTPQSVRFLGRLGQQYKKGNFQDHYFVLFVVGRVEHKLTITII